METRRGDGGQKPRAHRQVKVSVLSCLFSIELWAVSQPEWQDHQQEEETVPHLHSSLYLKQPGPAKVVLD